MHPVNCMRLFVDIQILKSMKLIKHIYMYTCMFCMIYHESTTYNTYLILEKGWNTILHIMKCTRLLVCLRLHVQMYSHISKQVYRHITRFLHICKETLQKVGS